jgi:hypothetical protein
MTQNLKSEINDFDNRAKTPAFEAEVIDHVISLNYYSGLYKKLNAINALFLCISIFPYFSFS